MKKRDLILHAAITVFAKDGLEKGKIADIAKEAGIGKGTVYEYFRSKEEIFLAIEESLFLEFQAEFETLLATDLSPAEKIEAIFVRTLEMNMRMGDAILIITELWAHSARWNWHSDDPSSLSIMYEQYKMNIESILKDGVKAGEFREMNVKGISALLLASMDGLSWQYMMMKDNKKFKIIQKEALRSFLRGIRK
ncbi:TetR/AcrR family transcriptional regulator [Caldithrix abyssi]|nr:TetR/AcrR family transcriptional regulator [Caldithrix abyssi]